MKKNFKLAEKGAGDGLVLRSEVVAAQRFSLVELLVVIAILAILASMLLPALNKAKEMAKSSLCISNLRQVSLAFFSYASDSGDYLPPVNSGIPGSAASTDYNWYTNILNTNGYLDAKNIAANGRCTEGVWLCPSTSSELVGTYSSGGYGVNQTHLFGFAGRTTVDSDKPFLSKGSLKISSVKQPSNMITVADSHFIATPVYAVNVFNCPCKSWGGGAEGAARHNGVNCSFMDGHVNKEIYNILRSNWSNSLLNYFGHSSL